ncbi:MAG: histidine phosphatase family protein [Rhodospirillaceae bacterium]|jgi:2,3-bisphosphoglycerate-dependent phosphoglycerate mutase|nr:histidine phosphatase family protein [Rhodospirillaceae bacterium]MBT6138879.1 histidine phosphatase family protein [Rhodospirillaceae bacterium]
MTTLALIRHGRTEWNLAGRIQGHSDQPLCEAGRVEVAALQVPPELDDFSWQTSPLGRARETAALLGHPDATVEPRLIEMDWGDWEGKSLAALRGQLGSEMTSNEDRGRDFQPTGGESPRQLQDRLGPWLVETGFQNEPIVAVCHKGVIRAVMALAFDWNMLGKPPVRLDWNAAHLFSVAADGDVSPHRLNLSLQPDR